VADIRMEKLAELLVKYSVGVKPGDKTAIMGESSAEPLLKAIYVNVLKAGGYPYIISSPGGSMNFFTSTPPTINSSTLRRPRN